MENLKKIKYTSILFKPRKYYFLDREAPENFRYPKMYI